MKFEWCGSCFRLKFELEIQPRFAIRKYRVGPRNAVLAKRRTLLNQIASRMKADATTKPFLRDEEW